MFREGVLISVVPSILAGALLCNCIPHLTSALEGRPFPTPFANPPGKGMSPPIVNVVWGVANLLLGAFIGIRRLPSLSPLLGLAAIGLGFLAAGVFLALHFGRVTRGRTADPSRQ